MTLQPSSTAPVNEAAAALEEGLTKVVEIGRVGYAHAREGSNIRQLARTPPPQPDDDLAGTLGPVPSVPTDPPGAALVIDVVGPIIEASIAAHKRVNRKPHHAARGIRGIRATGKASPVASRPSGPGRAGTARRASAGDLLESGQWDGRRLMTPMPAW